ncbi:MAG: flagellar export chaperone FlgN [Clostridiales bacterium]|nr:flagellar export chaperone FlgN [Clostridiales bacterium]
MNSQVNELLTGMVMGYQQQLCFYEHLHRVTEEECSTIAAGDLLTLSELLRYEDELVEQVKKLEEGQSRMRMILRQMLPGNSLALDQLACLCEPDVYIKFKQVVGEIKLLLSKIEVQKNTNVVALAEKLQECQDEISLFRRVKNTVGVYTDTRDREAKVFDVKQ